MRRTKGKAETSQMIPMDFAPGQVWTFRNTPSPRSRVLIGRIDDDTSRKGRRIISVSVSGVLDRFSSSDSKAMTEIGHMPMCELALKKSVLDLVGNGTPSDLFEQGYKIWRENFAPEVRGCLTRSLREEIDSGFDIVASCP